MPDTNGSDGMLSNGTVTTPVPFAITPLPQSRIFSDSRCNDSYNFCYNILHCNMPGTDARTWDMILLVPNLVFLAFLCYKAKRSLSKLRRDPNIMYITFYLMVWVSTLISVTRAVVALIIRSTESKEHTADRVLWAILQWCLLFVELCVVLLAVLASMDSPQFLRKILVGTAACTLCWSIITNVLEFAVPSNVFNEVYGHGGPEMWLVTSILLFVVYTTLVVLPHTRVRHVLMLPSKRSFYRYCGFLSLLNLFEWIGLSMLLSGTSVATTVGYCFVDFATAIYFSALGPLIYFTFLRVNFRNTDMVPVVPPHFAQPRSDVQGTDDDGDAHSVVNLPIDDYTADFAKILSSRDGSITPY